MEDLGIIVVRPVKIQSLRGNSWSGRVAAVSISVLEGPYRFIFKKINCDILPATFFVEVCFLKKKDLLFSFMTFKLDGKILSILYATVVMSVKF